MGWRVCRMSSLAMYFLFYASAGETPRRKLTWKILIVEGQGAINFSRKGPERKFVVRVQQEFGAPGKGLPVTFTLPATGPSGSFKHFGSTAVVKTDTDGYAVIRGFKPNKIAGRYNVEVSAPVQGSVIRGLIEQTNAQTRESVSQKVLHLFLKHRNSGDTERADP